MEAALPYFASHGLPSLIISIAAYVIGVGLLAITIRIWTVHPINRAFFFGDYLTPKGVIILLRLWPLVSLFGVLIFAGAIYHNIHWLYTNHGPTEAKGLALMFLGWLIAGIAVAIALAMVFVFLRGGLAKWLSQ